MAKRLQLLVRGGELDGRRFEVGDKGLRLGRSSANDIHVPDEELSRNHCIFDPKGETGIQVTDLVSANGTFVNGEQIGSDPVELKAGDIVGAGSLEICVVSAEGKVDLGLESKAADADFGASSGAEKIGKGHSTLVRIVMLAAALVCGVAIYLLLTAPKGEKEKPVAPVGESKIEVVEVAYEKVLADSKGIFRFEMTMSADRVLGVKVDDVPDENRHLAKNQPLSDGAFKEINQILDWNVIKDIDREYVGVEPDPPELNSYSLKIVYTTRARTIRIVNIQEPEAFRAIREKLEAFCKSELGVWAIQYPREKLLELAQDAIELGNAKWEDRDVNYGNLFASIAAYREAMFYLETVNPKPPSFAAAKEGKERSEAELKRRYEEQRFIADRALNLSQWEEAKRQLIVLQEMIPDRRDDRYRDANAKLMTAEKHLMKKGGR